MKIAEETIKRIIEKTDIVEVISEYVSLTKEGSLYRGFCPFHKEDTPSFTVVPNTQSYYCYGCGAGTKKGDLTNKQGQIYSDGGSDVVGFLMNIGELSFYEALQVLGNRAGIEVIVKTNPTLDKLKANVTELNRQYFSNLWTNQYALDYLHERGIDDESITRFRIGLVPETNRISFAITELSFIPEKGHTVAMAYRSINGAEPKYVNDATNSIFSKKNNLYLLPYAVKTIRSKGFAIVVEGYIDAILLHQSGLTNAVATMGTAFAAEQMDLLRTYTDTIYLWYDGDIPGKTAALKHIPGLLSRGFIVRLVISEDRDPADVVVSGVNIGTYLSQISVSAVQYIIEKQLKEFDNTINAKRLNVLNSLLPIINVIQNPAEKILYEQTMYQRLGLTG